MFLEKICSSVGIGFDDELWHIRQEVNNLKETLAMQSAYVQAMPSVGHIEVQTNSQDASDNHPRNETHIFMASFHFLLPISNLFDGWAY